MVWDEFLLSGPIIFLTEVLGFALGFLVFTLIWAAIGIGSMAGVDYLWPRISSALEPIIDRFNGTEESSDNGGRIVWILLGGFASLMVVTAVSAGVVLFGAEVGDWVADHQNSIATFFAVALVIFVILAGVDQLGRRVEAWIRRVASTAGPFLRSFASLATMVYLGPVLGWPVLRLLGLSRRYTYLLTLIAAPIFSAIWVPFYSFGVWGLVEEWL